MQPPGSVTAGGNHAGFCTAHELRLPLALPYSKADLDRSNWPTVAYYRPAAVAGPTLNKGLDAARSLAPGDHQLRLQDAVRCAATGIIRRMRKPPST